MTDAEATIKHCLLSGIIQNWHKKDSMDYAKLTQQEIFNRLFDKTTIWAVEEYLDELKMPNEKADNRS